MTMRGFEVTLGIPRAFIESYYVVQLEASRMTIQSTIKALSTYEIPPASHNLGGFS